MPGDAHLIDNRAVARRLQGAGQAAINPSSMRKPSSNAPDARCQLHRPLWPELFEDLRVHPVDVACSRLPPGRATKSREEQVLAVRCDHRTEISVFGVDRLPEMCGLAPAATIAPEGDEEVAISEARRPARPKHHITLVRRHVGVTNPELVVDRCGYQDRRGKAPVLETLRSIQAASRSDAARPARCEVQAVVADDNWVHLGGVGVDWLRQPSVVDGIVTDDGDEP